jgi:hypothetical protein
VKRRRRLPRPRLDGYLVEVVLDSGQRMHSDLFGEHDCHLAIALYKDLLCRTMVERIAIFRVSTGEVVRECDKMWTRPAPLGGVLV